jgi:hypothetical protein
MQPNDNKPEPLDGSDAEPSTPEIGYARPPVASRFKKGQSGNPLGRPKGKKNMATEFQEALGRVNTK